MAHRASSGIKDTVQLTIKHCLTNLLFSLFSSFFVLLFSIVLRQLCLLHLVTAEYQGIDRPRAVAAKKQHKKDLALLTVWFWFDWRHHK